MNKNDQLIQELMAGCVAYAIEKALQNHTWMMEDYIENTLKDEAIQGDPNRVIIEVLELVLAYSMHLRANYCEESMYAWENDNVDQDQRPGSGQGNSGELGERHVSVRQEGVLDNYDKEIKDLSYWGD